MASTNTLQPQPIVREAVVLVSMALVTLAIATALHLHAGFGIGTALVAAVAAYGVMLFAHGLYRRILGSEDMTALPHVSSGDGPESDDLARRVAEALQDIPDDRTRARGRPSTSAGSSRAEAAPGGVRGDRTAGSAGGASQKAAGASRAAAGASHGAAASERHDATAQASHIPDLPPARYTPVAERAVPPPQKPRAADLEMIQGLIKKLADEVNGTALSRDGETAVQAGGSPSSVSASGTIVSEDGPQSAAADASVDVLKSTAQDMRSLDARAGLAAGKPETAEALRSGSERLAAIRDAVSAGRIDIYLDPIVGLVDSQMQHYEVGLRLRDPDDNEIPLDTSPSALRGTGVFPLIDEAQLERTSVLAAKLQARGKTGSVFSRTHGESLIADPFLDTFAGAYEKARDTFAAQLVMTFTQDDVRGFGTREWATLADMADLGFRFAIASVSDLDMDFEDLAQRNFRYLKLDAGVFLNGLAAGEAFVPAEDICKHVSQLGMAVIVGGIMSEEARARIFGFGVLLGQGELFGAPRLVKAEAVMPKGHQSARSGGEAAA